MILHKLFNNEQQLLDGYHNFIQAYGSYLQTENIPTCLQDDIHQPEQAMQGSSGDDNEVDG